MMKRTIVLAVISMMMMAVQAQKEVGTFTVYPRFGVNISKFSGQKIYYDASDNYVKEKYKFGLSAGAELWYQFHYSLALSAGLIESNQGTKTEDINLESTNNAKETYSYSVNTQVLNIPLLLHVFVAPGLSFEAGVQPGFLLSAKSKENGEKNDVKSLMKTFDLSIPIGISYEYMNLQLDLRYNHGLTSLGDFFDKGHNRSIVLTLGYGIDF
jgi:hypothetical protein